VAVPAHPLLTAAEPLLRSVTDEAEAIDVGGVTAAHVRALGEVGLLGAWAPAAAGGGGAPATVVRELVERLSGASGALWFVAAQHRSPTEAALATDNAGLRERWAHPLASGAALGAVAFAHLRRPGPPGVRAERTRAGWSVSGRLDWVTSWGLADVLLLMAETDDGRVVQLLVPARERPGLTVLGPLRLAAMGATATVVVSLDEMVVSDEEVARILPKVAWSARDAERTANANPATFGLTRAALGRLATTASRRGSVAGADLAAELGARMVAVRRQAYRLMDDRPPADCLDERVRLRAEGLDLAQRATVGLVTAEAGRAMTLESPAQRWAREAMFHLVQAQTGPLREELLGSWRRGLPG
jgi:alkylation response protein AidB-like acyl-CoA dehydrogenase